VVGRAAGPGSSSPLLLRILGKRMGPLPACWVILPQDTGSYMCKRVCVCARARTRVCVSHNLGLEHTALCTPSDPRLQNGQKVSGRAPRTCTSGSCSPGVARAATAWGPQGQATVHVGPRSTESMQGR
jgi:hypothetical protein